MTIEQILTYIYLSQLLSGCYAIPRFTDFIGANRVLFFAALIWFVVLLSSIPIANYTNYLSGVVSPFGSIYALILAFIVTIYPSKIVLGSWLTNRKIVWLAMPMIVLIVARMFYMFVLGNHPAIYNSLNELIQNLGSFDCISRILTLILTHLYLIATIWVCYKSIPFYREYLYDNHSEASTYNITWLKNTLRSLIVLIVVITIQLSFNSSASRILWCLAVLYVWSSTLEGALFKGAFLIPEGVEVRIDRLSWCKIKLNYSMATQNEYAINITETNPNHYSEQLAEQLEKIMLSEKMFLNCDLKLTDLSDCFDETVDTKMISTTIHQIKRCTFMAYVQSYRIEYAKNLIMNAPELSIKEVAYRCGFNSVAAFTRSFGSIVGCPPSIYKRQMTKV